MKLKISLNTYIGVISNVKSSEYSWKIILVGLGNTVLLCSFLLINVNLDQASHDFSMVDEMGCSVDATYSFCGKIWCRILY